jgi:hypothetical protein
MEMVAQPLASAAGNAHAEVASILLARKDIDVNSTAATPLSMAAGNGQVGAVSILLERDDMLMAPLRRMQMSTRKMRVVAHQRQRLLTMATQKR